MGIAESWRAWRRGESFERVFGYAFIPQEEIDRNIDLTNRLEALNRQAFERGRISDAEYLARASRGHTSSITALLDNPDSSPLEGFREGFKEGASAIQSGIKGAVAAPINFTLGAIPWQIWAIGLGLAAWKLGLLRGLKIK